MYFFILQMTKKKYMGMAEKKTAKGSWIM